MKSNCIKMLSILGLLIILSNSLKAQGNSEIAEEGTFTVVGQVIDNQGKEISMAQLSLYVPPCEKCFDHIIPSIQTTANGHFFFDVRMLLNDKNLKQFTLFIGDANISDKYWYPLGKIDLHWTKFSEFHGIIVNAPKNGGEVNLGKVTPTPSIKNVSIDLVKLFEENNDLLKKKFSIKVAIKYKGDRFLSNLLVSQKYIDSEKGSLNLRLPIGKWSLSFTLNDEITKEKTLDVK